MDAWFTGAGYQRRTVAFLSHWQAEGYGGYAAAASKLKTDHIMSPDNIGEFWSDIESDREVGHA